MCVELESVKEQHVAAQLSAQEEKKSLQQQLLVTQEKLAALSSDSKREEVNSIQFILCGSK